jgi:hypothetical protein
MNQRDFTGLNDDVKERFLPFLQDISDALGDRMLSASVTGSALTADYVPKRSDVR